MAISVTCECGKQFKVKDELAGKRGKCSSCGQVLSIPTLASSADPEKATPAPLRACPACWEALQPNAVICLHCGHDLRTGKQVPQAKPSEPAAPARPSAEASAGAKLVSPSRLPWLISGVSAFLLIVVSAMWLMSGGNTRARTVEDGSNVELTRTKAELAKVTAEAEGGSSELARKNPEIAKLNADLESAKAESASLKSDLDKARTEAEAARTKLAQAGANAKPLDGEKAKPPQGISIAELPPPLALPEMPKDIGWSKYNKDQLDKVISGYDKDQVSAFLEFKDTTSRTNENAPNAVQHAWLKKALEITRPQTVAVLERDLALAVAQDDFRGALFAILAANKVDKEKPLRGQELWDKLKGQILAGAAGPQHVWKLTQTKAAWHGDSYSEGLFANKYTLSSNPGFKLLRVSATVENISPKPDPLYASKALGGLEGALLEIDEKVFTKSRRLAVPSFVWLLQKPSGTNLDILMSPHVMESSPALRGMTITTTTKMSFTGTYIEQGKSFQLDVLFSIPQDTAISDLRLLFVGASPVAFAQPQPKEGKEFKGIKVTELQPIKARKSNRDICIVKVEGGDSITVKHALLYTIFSATVPDKLKELDSELLKLDFGSTQVGAFQGGEGTVAGFISYTEKIPNEVQLSLGEKQSATGSVGIRVQIWQLKNKKWEPCSKVLEKAIKLE